MGYHKLLQKQIRKHFTEDFQKDPAFLDFISDINSSYLTFERDNNLLNNSFSICEKEYKTLCDNLKRESHLKNISLEKLKTALRNIENDNDSKFNLESDDLLVIVDYLNSEIDKRKDTQVSLNNTLKLLTAVLSNLNSGILFENENILYKNKLFCNIFSMTYNPEMIIGKNFSNSEFQIKNCFENIEKYEERISFILHNKVAVFGDELKLKDGRILERNYIPIYIENQYKGHLWDYKDITERIKFESQLVDLTNIQNAILNGNDYSIF